MHKHFIIFFSVMVFFICACIPSMSSNNKMESREIPDSLEIDLYQGLFLPYELPLMVACYVENKDSLFCEMESVVKSYIDTHNLSEEDWNMATRSLFTPREEHYHEISNKDEYWAWQNISAYLTNRELKRIHLVSPYVYDILRKDEKDFEKLLGVQIEWLSVHFDATGNSGSGYWMKYFDIDIEMKQWMYDYYEEMYRVLTLEDFKLPKTYDYISDDLIKAADKHINSYVIPHYTELEANDEKADRRVKKEESATWWNLINHREHAIIKNSSVKQVYDNFTNRLRFLRLVQLKNEFEQYGGHSSDVTSVLLPDTCSFEELLNYSNFSSEWDNYVK